MNCVCYFEPATCYGELWTCQTCGEQFCQAHSHTTDRGRNVECAACEYNRPDFERDYPQGEPEAT
jgi:DNA-directed RNA polymerase subunit RPC12/RpoP